MNIRLLQFIFAISVAGLLAGCAATEPPPLPQNDPADPQVRSSSTGPPNLLVRDETTLAIEKRLSATKAEAKKAESMQHDMQNMPGMNMPQGHEGMQHGNALPADKKAMEDKMKKTSDEMKATSDAMKQKSDETKAGAPIYACPMHPEVQSDKPGKCPKCGMALVKKEAGR
jgi:Heavy metal binding domain